MNIQASLAPVSGDEICKKLNAQARLSGWAVHCDAGLEFEHPELNAMREVWLGQCGSCLPARATFTPRMLKPFMSNMFTVEIHAGENHQRRYLHRFVGTALVRIFGEMTGRYLDEYLPPALLPKSVAYYDAVAANGIAIRLVSNFELEQVDYLQCEALMMPLADDGITPDRLMIVTYFKPRPQV